MSEYYYPEEVFEGRVPDNDFSKVAKAYFESLKPKPQPGEVWQLSGDYLLVDGDGELRDPYGRTVVFDERAEKVLP